MTIIDSKHFVVSAQKVGCFIFLPCFILGNFKEKEMRRKGWNLIGGFMCWILIIQIFKYQIR